MILSRLKLNAALLLFISFSFCQTVKYVYVNIGPPTAYLDQTAIKKPQYHDLYNPTHLYT